MSIQQLEKVSQAQASSTRSTGLENDSIGLTDLEALVTEQKRNEAILAWCNNQYSRCKSARYPIERKWYLWMAFYFGRQNVTVVNSSATTNGFQLYTPKAPPWRVRLVINKIRVAIRKQVSNLTSQKPRFFSIPAGTSDADLMSARVAESILDCFYRESHIKTKIRSMVWWGSILGTAFTKTYWDKFQKDSNGTQGNICSEVIPPFYIYVPDLLQPDIELQPYVIHVTTINPELAKIRYNLDTTPNVVAASNVLEDQFLSMIGAQAQRKDQVLNLEFWIKPNLFKLFPRGAMVTICGDKVVQFKEGMPYAHGQFPFAKFTDVDTGAFYGSSVIEDLLPLQREFNRTRSQIVEAKNLMAKPKLLAARGSVNANQITSEPGQVILFTPGFDKPTPLPLTPLPSYVLDEVSRLNQDMQDMLGQHDISQLISSRTSATALSYVQNADATVTSSATDSIENVVEKTGRQVLSLVKQYWTTARTVKIVGPDEAFEAQQWSGKDIRDYTEVYVEPGSALPQDRSAKQAFLMDLFKMGAIRPQQMLEMLDIGGIEKVYEDYLVDKRQAQRENIRMVQLAQEFLKQPAVPLSQQMAVQMAQVLGGNGNVGTAAGWFGPQLNPNPAINAPGPGSIIGPPASPAF